MGRLENYIRGDVLYQGLTPGLICIFRVGCDF